jgi:hypothetical protein
MMYLQLFIKLNIVLYLCNSIIKLVVGLDQILVKYLELGHYNSPFYNNYLTSSLQN